MIRAAPFRVIKLGGSLLDWGGMPETFEAWLSSQPPLGNVVVTGGGRLVDVIRAADRLHRRDDEAAHWLAIRCMSITAHLAARLLPDAVVVSTNAKLETTLAAGQLAILDPLPFLVGEVADRSPGRLPCSWDVSSDSIAAHLATRFCAEELVLLKSAQPPQEKDWHDLATAGYVDRFFPRAAARVARVRSVNLRNPNFAQRQPARLFFCCPVVLSLSSSCCCATRRLVRSAGSE